MKKGQTKLDSEMTVSAIPPNAFPAARPPISGSPTILSGGMHKQKTGSATGIKQLLYPWKSIANGDYPAGIFNFGTDVCGRIPAAVCKHNEHKRKPDGFPSFKIKVKCLLLLKFSKLPFPIAKPAKINPAKSTTFKIVKIFCTFAPKIIPRE